MAKLPAEDIVILIDGLKIRGKVYNPQAKITALGLHGWLDNCHSFIPLAKAMPHLKIIAMDLPGHGKSDHFHPAHYYQFLDFVRVGFSLHQKLSKQYENLGWLGHSLGAAVSSFGCTLGGGSATWCVLLDGLGPLANDEQSIYETFRTHVRQVKKLSAINAKSNRDLKVGRYPDYEALIHARHAVGGGLKKSSAKLLVQRQKRKSQTKTLAESDPQITWGWTYDEKVKLRSPVRLTEPQVLAFIEKIECPTLLVHFDAWQGSVLFEKRMHASNNIEAIHVAGHHHTHMDQPKKVAQQITEFFKSKLNYKI